MDKFPWLPGLWRPWATIERFRPEPPPRLPIPVEPQGPDFGSLLQDYLNEVNRLQQQADNLAQRFARGEPVEEHTLMLALERAGLAFQLTLQVRNRVLEAYQEIMRLQL